MCAWGFGEIAPPSNSSTTTDYVMTDEEQANITEMITRLGSFLTDNGGEGGYVYFSGTSNGASWWNHLYNDTTTPTA